MPIPDETASKAEFRQTQPDYVSNQVHIGREESVKRTLRNQRLGRIPAQLNSLQGLIIGGEWAQTSEPNPQQQKIQ